MKKTATLIFRIRNLGTGVKLILTILFLNCLVQNTAAQININGLSTEWSSVGIHYQDRFGNGENDTSFTEGSKDFFFAADWRWVFGQTKAKNDIANGAAVIVNSIDTNGVAYIGSGGPYLAFAGDRTSNNGAAQIGFWFFQNGTAPTTQGDGTRNFAPPKTVGDLLVLADFSAGGRSAKVTVLRWVGDGSGDVVGSNGNLDSVNIGAAVAQNNSGTTSVPTGWAYLTGITSYELNAFYEGFVDLGTFGPGAACFSRVLLETRSSHEISASLDDFVDGPLGGAPTCNITGNNTICSYQSATFTASGGVSYSWSGPGGFTGNTAVVSNLTAAGTYNVTVSNAQGCTSSCSRVLTVNTPITCDITGNNTICSYQSATFTAAAGGQSYSWSGPGGFTANTQVISNLTAAGTYNVTITSAQSCTSSCSRVLTVNTPITCDITGNNTICSYQSTSFTAAAGGQSYSWSGPGGFTASTQVINNLTAAGTYNVTITSPQGCTSSCSRVLTVNNPIPCDITGNNTICNYQSATFTAAAGGQSYSWTGPGGFTGNTQVVNNLTAAGTYNVTITSPQGCTSSCSRVLTVNTPITCNITGNNTICVGQSTSFTASAGGQSYSWSGPGGFTANTQVINNLTAAGTYNVTITSPQGCTSSCNRVLTVITNPVCEISGNGTICQGASTCFTASGGSSYSWTGPGGFTATSAEICNLTAAGTYNVTVTAAGGCTSSCSKTLTVNTPITCNITGNNTICNYQSATFTAAAGGQSYSWSGPGGFTASSQIVSNLTAAGTYNVTITSPQGCTSSCSRVLTVNTPITCNITGNNTICANTSATFTAAAGGQSYAWSGPGGFTGNTQVVSNLTAAGTYNVTITSPQGCTSSCSRTLTINPLPDADAGTDPAAQCRNASVVDGVLVFGMNTFSVTGTATNGTPAWSIAPGGNPNGYTVNIVSPNSLSTNVEVSGNVNGGTVTLRLTVTSNTSPPCGSDFDDVVLTLNPRPLLKQVIGSDFCPNVTTTGSVTLVGSENGVSYQLKDDGNNNVQAPKLGDGNNLVWTGLAPGSYTVVGTFLATTCNTTSGPGEVVENPVPDVSITPVEDKCSTDECITLAALPAGGTFGGPGVTGNQFCPGTAGVGSHTITYSYTNTDGCTASTSITIDVISCQDAICTYTQGAFGNEGGQDCDGTTSMPTEDLINQSLTNWAGTNIKIGWNTNYVQINDTDADCIITVLPGGGPAKEISGAHQICSLPASMLKNGRINNVLLSQTITLGLNIGITSPSVLSDFALQAGTLSTAAIDGGCGSDEPKLRECVYDPNTGLLIDVINPYESRSFSQALIDAIDAAGYPKTVGGLFSLANDALGNKDGVVGSERGVSLSEIAGAAGSINEVFDECRVSVGWNVAPCPLTNILTRPAITFSATEEATRIAGGKVDKLTVSAFPNPYRTNVRFVIQSPISGQAVLDVYNIAGQKVQTLFNGRIQANEVRTVNYRPSAGNGMMIYKFRVGSQQVTGKLVALTE